MYKRGDRFYLYVPTQDGDHILRATGTSDKRLAGRMRAMIAELRDKRNWPALELVSSGRASIGRLYDAYANNAMDAFIGLEASPQWETMLDGWLRSLPVRETTRSTYRRQVEAVLPAGMRVHALTSGVVRDALAALDVTPGTRATYFAALRSFLHYLVGHDLLPVHPMAEKSKVPRPKKNKPRTTWMTDAEDLRLCLAAPSPLREYFALVHSTGAERMAALNMTRADVDLDRWEVHIPGTKNENRDRYHIPVDVWARPILAPYVRSILHGPLFPTISPAAVSRAHVAARKAVGMEGYQLRDARHSVAIRWLVRDSVPIWDVAERLGHADSTQALKVYTKTMLREAARRLGVDNMTTNTTRKEAAE